MPFNMWKLKLLPNIDSLKLVPVGHHFNRVMFKICRIVKSSSPAASITTTGEFMENSIPKRAQNAKLYRIWRDILLNMSHAQWLTCIEAFLTIRSILTLTWRYTPKLDRYRTNILPNFKAPILISRTDRHGKNRQRIFWWKNIYVMGSETNISKLCNTQSDTWEIPIQSYLLVEDIKIGVIQPPT